MLILVATLFGCAPQPNGAPASPNATNEQSVGAYTQEMTDDAAKQMESELGAFEITAAQRELAKTNEAGYAPLDAGRGNPNWINSKARYAYTRLMDFATQECQRTISNATWPAMPYARALRSASTPP